MERQGRQAGGPTEQGRRFELGWEKGTETARRAREIVRGEAGLKRQGRFVGHNFSGRVVDSGTLVMLIGVPVHDKKE